MVPVNLFQRFFDCSTLVPFESIDCCFGYWVDNTYELMDPYTQYIVLELRTIYRSPKYYSSWGMDVRTLLGCPGLPHSARVILGDDKMFTNLCYKIHGNNFPKELDFFLWVLKYDEN
ncbi:Hypothetical predicted protein [Prunus dulcis]|uniref:Uncharacterized protein n=1 Tax=Prunus dulcis TaxID=3755 RepID=A0A5E4FWF0_PRUDU|nr:Hypothetical predicted protein [Prunus dulcis]